MPASKRNRKKSDKQLAAADAMPKADANAELTKSENFHPKLSEMLLNRNEPHKRPAMNTA